MAKARKKTKTAKQKQIKAANKLAKTFAKRLGVSSGKPLTQDGIVVGVKSTPQGSMQNKATKEQKYRMRQPAKKQKMLRKGQVPNSIEVREFQKAQQSLNERARAMESSLSSKGGKRNRSRPPVIQFEPARLALADKDKSTMQLINETALKVQNMDGFGFVPTTPFAPAPATFMSSGAPSAAAPLWSEPVQPQHERKVKSNNPWDALADEDGDDDANGKMQSSNTGGATAPPAFQFAAPTFNFNPITSSAQAVGDVDPDL